MAKAAAGVTRSSHCDAPAGRRPAVARRYGRTIAAMTAVTAAALRPRGRPASHGRRDVAGPGHGEPAAVETWPGWLRFVAYQPVCRVLMLTAASTVRERVDGLGLGTDGYLPKPFDFAELVARMRALGRRSAAALPPALECGDVTLDPKGLRAGSLGLLSSVVIAVSSTAPAYSMAATLGLVVAIVGVHSPGTLIVSFLPTLFIAYAFRELNKVDPDCGTTFTWTNRAFGPWTGWMGGCCSSPGMLVRRTPGRPW
jgi:hypothetical protein